MILSEIKKDEILAKNPHAKNFIKKYLGNKDFMSGNKRYCIWITEKNKEEAHNIEEFKVRFEKVKQFRLASQKEATKRKAETPYLMVLSPICYFAHSPLNSINTVKE